MSNAATMEAPPFVEVDESEWVILDFAPVKAPSGDGWRAAARLEARGSGRDRHFLIPRGRLTLARPDTVLLPPADDLDQALVVWPPPAGDLYLADPGPRAIFQGDVYENVPYTKAGAGTNIDSNPSWSAKRRHVATLLHPCYIVDSDNVTPIRAQPVALVYDAHTAGLRIADDWEGVIAVCPLPDLVGDDRMWVADFRKITAVDRSYLVDERRVRCLSELGWAHFRQRFIGATTRALIMIDDLMEVGAVPWVESEMETAWVREKRERREFHAWLDSSAQVIGYASWRRALEAGDFEAVWKSLTAVLSE